jgi:hypothetical protein
LYGHAQWPSFDVDDVFGQTEFLCDGEWHGGEGLVDLDAFHIAELPSGTLQRLPDSGTGPRPNIPGSTAATP